MVKNAKTLPRRFFGLHMVEGVAEYREAEKDPYRIFIGEETIKNMDPTFEGKPVYVHHVDQVNIDKIQEEADGYVVRSFFNKADGKHWVEFLVVSDRGHEAIRNGWKLSNAYIPKTLAQGGEWHGVEYSKEITNGEYEHLAIVQNPRYAESVILTPEEFKKYNGEKEIELTRLANEKETSNMLSFFKKSKVDNSKDFEEMSVVLPKSKAEMTLAQVVEIADKVKNMAGYAAEDHMVKVGNEEMSVKELVKKHQAMCQELEEMKKPKDGEGEEKKNDAAEAELDEAKKKEHAADDEKKEEKKENKDDEKKEEEKKSNEADKKAKEEADKLKKLEAEKKKIEQETFDALKNASNSPIKEEAKIQLSEDLVARGKARYGSN